jgi:phage gp29-like protein
MARRVTERRPQRQVVIAERRRQHRQLPPPERAEALNGNGQVRITRMPRPGERLVIKTSDRIREQLHDKLLPAEVQSILRLALTGSLIYQQRLFERMCDSWPRLQKDINELASAVQKVPWDVQPAKEEGQEPTSSAAEKADLVERAIKSFRPDIKRQQRDFDGLIHDIVFSIFVGHIVDELYWEQRGPETMPLAAKMIPARYYGYPILTEEEDRLMLNRKGNLSNAMGDLEEFPPNQFIIGINQRHTAHPTVSAMFRCLAGWWLASVYGLEWFMSFSELFGVPYRIGKYQAGSIDAKNALLEFMRDLGSGGWGVFPDNTEVQVIDTSKGAGELPQKVMQEMADRVCDILILGQTLTTDVASGGSGNRALGQVHQDIRDEVLENAVNYTATILNTQFVPSVIGLNYGNLDELPQFSGTVDQPQDEKALAETALILFGGPPNLQIPITLADLRNRLKLPIPAEGEELYMPPAGGGGGGGGLFGGGEPSTAAALLMAALAGNTAPRRPNLEHLVDNVMENLTGVSSEWLKPVKPIFADLVGMARDKTLTDQDFIRALTQASQRMPDLFHHLNTEALEQELHKAMNAGVINGVSDRHIKEAPKA